MEGEVLTHDNFAQLMELIARDPDPEMFHREADKLMCDLLVSLGYEEGVDIFNKHGKWYA